MSIGEISEDRRAQLTAKGLVLSWWAEQRPEDMAIVSQDGNRTFAQLDRRSNQLVRALRRLGVSAGASVALVCGNRPEFAEVVAACNRSGLRLTTVNWHLSADEARYIATDCEATVVIVDPGLGPSATGAADSPVARVRLAVGAPCDGFESYEGAVSAEDGGPLLDPTPGSVMLYTSGTTGRPKGVRRPPGTSTAAAALNIYDYREDGTDVHLCTGPLYHAAPLAFSLSAPLAFGTQVVLMESWDAERCLGLIE
ncbi:MAG: AMP-binding protein, partial [Acidimicrobiales bacterium]